MAFLFFGRALLVAVMFLMVTKALQDGSNGFWGFCYSFSTMLWMVARARISSCYSSHYNY